jgi:hypothetical protein
MNFSNLTKRLRADSQTYSGTFVAPAFGIEFQAGFIAAARMNSPKHEVLSVGIRELADGVLAPSPNKANLSNGKAVRQAITEVCERVGNGGGRIGLLLPDVSARVALLQFETLPDSRRDAEALVRWKMREYLPYPPEEARLTYQILGKQGNQLELLAVAVRGSVLAEFEAAIEGIDRGGASLILPSTCALLPLLPEDAGGQFLVHICPGSLTAVVIASNTVRYWRTRQLIGDTASITEEVGREAARVLATCQDNLGVQVENVWYCARPPAAGELEAALERALGRKLSSLPINSIPAGGLPSGQDEIFETFGLPFAGLLANPS